MSDDSSCLVRGSYLFRGQDPPERNNAHVVRPASHPFYKNQFRVIHITTFITTFYIYILEFH